MPKVRTKNKMAQEVRAIISRVGCTDSVRITHPNEYEFLRELLLSHPDDKAAGMCDIQIKHNTASYVLYYVTPDKTDSISWKCCIFGGTSREQVLRSAMRTDIRDQTVAFRTGETNKHCAICGVLTTNDFNKSPTSVPT